VGDISVGVDLGRKQDYTAIVGAEVIDGKNDEFNIPLFERLQLGTPFRDAIGRLIEVRDWIKKMQNKRDRERGRFPSEIQRSSPIEILVDASGLGDPVVEEMRHRGLEITGVLLTGGNKCTKVKEKNGWALHIPKSALVSRLQVLAQGHRIHFTRESSLVENMIEELENFTLKVTSSANLQFEPFTTGVHDDLIVATALAVWKRRRKPTGFLRVYCPEYFQT